MMRGYFQALCYEAGFFSGVVLRDGDIIAVFPSVAICIAAICKVNTKQPLKR